MEALYFEDYEPGSRFRTRRRTLTEADLSSFVGVTGMFESLFIDRDAAEAAYGGRLVPGALTYAFSEGLVIQEGVLHDRGLAFLSATIRAERPVFVGDTLCVEVETTSKRHTRRPDRGVVETTHRILNQRDEVVMLLQMVRMIRRRPSAGSDARESNVR